MVKFSLISLLTYYQKDSMLSLLRGESPGSINYRKRKK
nr:MAG TPA: hypothetical protein [Caudoviricetes sp.]